MPERPDDFEVARMILTRERRLGTSFDDAWRVAVGALSPLDTHTRAGQDRDRVLNALHATRPVWEAAYRREAPPAAPYSARENLKRLRRMMAASHVAA